MAMDNPFIMEEDLNKPTECTVCKGKLKYEGLGTYKCLSCNNLEFDDYGKVRKYLEEHKAVNIATVSKETNVSRRVIQYMLDQERFSTSSKAHLHVD